MEEYKAGNAGKPTELDAIDAGGTSDRRERMPGYTPDAVSATTLPPGTRWVSQRAETTPESNDISRWDREAISNACTNIDNLLRGLGVDPEGARSSTVESMIGKALKASALSGDAASVARGYRWFVVWKALAATAELISLRMHQDLEIPSQECLVSHQLAVHMLDAVALDADDLFTTPTDLTRARRRQNADILSRIRPNIAERRTALNYARALAVIEDHAPRHPDEFSSSAGEFLQKRLDAYFEHPDEHFEYEEAESLLEDGLDIDFGDDFVSESNLAYALLKIDPAFRALEGPSVRLVMRDMLAIDASAPVGPKLALSRLAVLAGALGARRVAPKRVGAFTEGDFKAEVALVEGRIAKAINPTKKQPTGAKGGA